MAESLQEKSPWFWFFVQATEQGKSSKRCQLLWCDWIKESLLSIAKRRAKCWLPGRRYQKCLRPERGELPLCQILTPYVAMCMAGVLELLPRLDKLIVIYMLKSQGWRFAYVHHQFEFKRKSVTIYFAVCLTNKPYRSGRPGSAIEISIDGDLKLSIILSQPRYSVFILFLYLIIYRLIIIIIKKCFGFRSFY